MRDTKLISSYSQVPHGACGGRKILFSSGIVANFPIYYCCNSREECWVGFVVFFTLFKTFLLFFPVLLVDNQRKGRVIPFWLKPKSPRALLLPLCLTHVKPQSSTD